MVKCEMQESLILCCWGSKCILITAVKLWINQFVKSFPRKNPFDSPRIMHGLDITDTQCIIYFIHFPLAVQTQQLMLVSIGF